MARKDLLAMSEYRFLRIASSGEARETNERMYNKEHEVVDELIIFSSIS